MAELPFDYRTADVGQILEFSRWLSGRTLKAIHSRIGSTADLSTLTKGTVGHLIEEYFGIPKNSRQEADFPLAGVELKVVPVEVRKGGHYRAKERTVLTQINYGTLVRETWESAALRKKLDRILFVFFQVERSKIPYEWKCLSVVYWNGDAHILPVVRRDWELVQGKVKAGLAHELSGRDTELLEAATKARDSSVTVEQPNSPIPAKPRAWSLKAKFGTALFVLDHSRRKHAEIVELTDHLRDEDRVDVVDALVDRINRHSGESLRELSQKTGMQINDGKSGAAQFLRQLFGIRHRDAVFKELVELGVTVRTVRVSPKGAPYESTSFPYFDYFELAEEEWNESALRETLETLLFIPLVGATRESPRPSLVIGRAFLWRPTASEWDGIEQEWTRYRDLIRDGHAARLPPASGTKFIHVRPHGRTSEDTLPTPGGGHAVKSSFWLNDDFVGRLVRAADPMRYGL